LIFLSLQPSWGSVNSSPARVYTVFNTCVDGAYERHGGGIKGAWKWAGTILHHLKAGGSSEQYATQDVLDLVFLNVRLERFSDGHIRSEEALLRDIVREVVRRVQSSCAPVFLVQK
jgi:hypothetical protein